MNKSNKIKRIFNIPKIISNGSVEYHTKELIGKGGYSICYKVYNQESNMYYAAKIFNEKEIESSKMARKFYNKEIDIHKSLDHPNIVKFIDNFEIDINGERLLIFILELCKESLSDVLIRDKKINENTARLYLKQIISALIYIHEKNIIHRDIKLNNILITWDDTIKLCDFGMADYIDEVEINICGTPNYISPEVLEKKKINKSVDVWALGVTIYFMLIGHGPFETSSAKDTYKKITSGIYNYPINSNISHNAKSLIDKMLIKDPNKRIKSEDILKEPFLKIKINTIDNILNKLNINLLSKNIELGENKIYIAGYKNISKCGLFYLLSNGTYGAYFNDGDIMIKKNNIITRIGKKKINNFIDSNIDIEKKYKLIKNINIIPSLVMYNKNDNSNIYVTKYLQTNIANFFRLNKILQVNFDDGDVVIISENITYINKNNELIKKIEYIRDILKLTVANRK